MRNYIIVIFYLLYLSCHSTENCLERFIDFVLTKRDLKLALNKFDCVEEKGGVNKLINLDDYELNKFLEINENNRELFEYTVDSIFFVDYIIYNDLGESITFSFEVNSNNYFLKNIVRKDLNEIGSDPE